MTCPVCFESYDNPKTLPCLHSFCLKCIEPDEISCPACRITADNGMNNQPAAVIINNLPGIQESLKVNINRSVATTVKFLVLQDIVRSVLLCIVKNVLYIITS